MQVVVNTCRRSRVRDRVYAVAFSHDLTQLALASNNTVKIWNTSSGEYLQTLEGHNNTVFSMVFSHDSTRFASASTDGTVKIWDASSGKCLQTLKNYNFDIYTLTLSRSKMVLIRETNSREDIQIPKSHNILVPLVIFSHDSTWLASASYDNTVKIWDASSGECLQIFKGHSLMVLSVVFSHDSTRLASTSYDNTVKIWDTSSGECLQTLCIGKTIFNVLFDTTGSHLHTEIGIVAIDTSSASNMNPTVMDHENPRYQGLALSSDGAWITYNSKNLVWLPSEYRSSCSIVSGRAIGTGVGSGKIWIYHFNVDDSYFAHIN
jgi:WD40 repeat protein